VCSNVPVLEVCVFVNISRYGFVIIGYSHRWAVLHVFFVLFFKQNVAVNAD